MPHRSPFALTLPYLAALALAALTPGCQPAAAPVANDPSPTAEVVPKAVANDPSPMADPPADVKPLRETWDIFSINGVRVGYGRTRVLPAQRDGRELLRVEGLQRMKIQRFRQTIEQELTFTSLETPDGQLVEFESSTLQGPTPVKTVGRVDGDKLRMQTTTAGETRHSAIDWKPDYAGLHGPDATLLRKPMQPGETRTLEALIVAVNQVAHIDMQAKQYEPVSLRGGDYELLRIENQTLFADGAKFHSTVWCDRTGEVLKSVLTDAMNLEVYRATKLEALDETPTGELDLGWDIAVKLDAPLTNIHQSPKARYRVTLDGRDPAGVFPIGDSQQVQPLEPHVAEITVMALRPGRSDGNENAPADPPTVDDREPSGLVQSDDAQVVRHAGLAAGNETDPWTTAVALEQYVRRTMKKSDLTQAFASAAEVARQPTGDCTEHAVFLCALARARGIPSRAAMGLVYMEGSQSFGYHMWSEVYIDKRWIPLDGTLGLGGIGAGHLKLAHSSLRDGSSYTSMLPVMQIAGRLKIDHIKD
jgi:hypothetical protein